jgi:hypothetical protein
MGTPRVWVADLRGEELEKPAAGAVTGGSDQGGKREGGWVGKVG